MLMLTLCINKSIGSCCSYDYVSIMIPNLDSYLNYKFTCFDSCHLCFMTKVYVTTMQVHQFLLCISNVICKFMRSPSPLCVCNHALSLPFRMAKLGLKRLSPIYINGRVKRGKIT